MVELLGRVLSISSHVTHGYVGNRATVFPLQFYGWDVDEIYTTNFSNHPGYGRLKRAATSAELVKDLFEGLHNISSLGDGYDIILVGYCPSPEIMALVYDRVELLVGTRNGDKSPVLIVDPVLGDNGNLYVPREIVDVHAKYLLGKAQLTTPNQFELEVLTGITVSSRETAHLALNTFWEKYHVPNVVISSALIDGAMYSVGYVSGAEPETFFIPIRQIDCKFSGCGDVFTALLAHVFSANQCLLSAHLLQKVVDQVHGILTISYECEKERLGSEPSVVRDIKLIQSSCVLAD